MKDILNISFQLLPCRGICNSYVLTSNLASCVCAGDSNVNPLRPGGNKKVIHT